MNQIDSSIVEPPSARASSKRQAILDAAKRSFVRDGVIAGGIDAIAVEAGVSRQTVYNLIGDRDQLFRAVVEEVTTRSSASLMTVIATFPSRPDDIQAALTDFAVRMLGRCLCDIDGQALSTLIKREAHKHPELFKTWEEYGPGKDWPVIAAQFARLARDGYIEIDDPSLAARHFFALICSDLPTDKGPCALPTEEAIRKTAAAGVKTFLRAFGSRQSTSA
ncbi:TetR/AcrR family transcriptional regulator [Devosia sp.]|uniref:TetR/AcrR family transcriptional regulator n=1 Tax=Devosia sp. TaxID=1871048 RepID=UPI0032648CF4